MRRIVLLTLSLAILICLAAAVGAKSPKDEWLPGEKLKECLEAAASKDVPIVVLFQKMKGGDEIAIIDAGLGRQTGLFRGEQHGDNGALCRRSVGCCACSEASARGFLYGRPLRCGKLSYSLRNVRSADGARGMVFTAAAGGPAH
mgnify:CR=1 FL=1